MFYLVCYLRHGDRVFETYWTRGRGVEAMAPSYGLLDMTVLRAPGAVGGLPRRLAAAAGAPAASTPTAATDARSPSGRACSAGRSDDLGTAVG